MTTVPTSIFITGATGYIGGSILSRLLEHPRLSAFRITALVRSLEKAQQLESIGVKTVVGSYSDLDKLENSAAQADYVFIVANGDDEPANNAILRGLKKRFEVTGKASVLIHTSGTGILCDEALGMHASDTICSDYDIDQIESLPPSRVHRPTDIAVVAADQAGYIRSYIVLPGVVYGVAKGRLADLGIQSRNAILFKLLVPFSLARNSGFVIGEGKNIWPAVNVGDCADLYIILFNAILDGKHVGHGREGYYFAENGEYMSYQLCKATASALYELGLLRSDEPTPLTEEEFEAFGQFSGPMGANARCRADRSRALGWKPVSTTNDFMAGIQDEVKALGESFGWQSFTTCHVYVWTHCQRNHGAECLVQDDLLHLFSDSQKLENT